ncbi:MAG TPA: type I polyketide synthase [Anaerolineaceae bacterium]
MEITAIKLALLAQQIRAQSESGEYLNSEPIAVVGMSCRFPGGANSVDAYWKLLRAGTDAIGEIPADRWDINALYDPAPETPGKMTTRWGGFLDYMPDTFDAAFFGLSPREATRMDPQQRLVLEVAYEALEDAGQTRDTLSGTATGVFIASYHNDYASILNKNWDQIDAYSSTGTAHSIVANRLSYLLNLNGPSLSVDTACSSSLVAAHLACQSLRSGESDLAVAGGVSLMFTPEVTISLSKWGFMAADGRCKAFDSRADGFVRGEGCGMIVLKRLSDALADGDRIYALIRGTAVNQDGRSTVLTAPNGLAQQAVIRKAIENAHVHPADVGYIEAHGTGTSLGDPIEVDALTAVYGQPRAAGNDCVLTSVKTNIGHLEAAAGVAGLIKVVLSMRHGLIPRHLHFRQLNPHISLEGTPFVIPVEEYPWPAGQRARLAGVSSFGFGGTNAHLILEESPVLPEPAAEPAADRPVLLPFSAQSPEGVRDLARAYQIFLSDPDRAASLADIGFTASQLRSHFDYRAAVTGESVPELVERLGWLADGAPRPGAAANGPVTGDAKPAFIFSGQGPQWWAMGRGLFEREPVYRQAIERIDAMLRPYTGWSLIEELSRGEQDTRLDQTEIAQPAIFAMQVALAALWESWGVTPSAVVGHSIGEIAAAHIVGVLTLEDAVRVVYHRARLMQRATGLGKMAAVELPGDETAQVISSLGLEQAVSVAAINSPTSVTISGESAALEKTLKALEERGAGYRMLRVNYAFHSPQMEPYRLELAEVLGTIATHPAKVPVISTLTAQPAQAGDYDAAYWGENIRRPVQFAGAVQYLIGQGITCFLEVSPHPVLAAALTQGLDYAGQPGVVLASQRRGQPEHQTLFNTLAELYALGAAIRWEELYPEGQAVSLPAYPWQRQRYWFEPKPSAVAPAASAFPGGGHPLLGQQVISPALKGSLHQAFFTAEYPALLADHIIYDNVVVPGTAYLEMALAACPAGSDGTLCALEDFTIQEALILPAHETRVVQFIRAEDGKFEIFSRDLDTETWKQHAAGQYTQAPAAELPAAALDEARRLCAAVFPVESYAQRIASLGIRFGARFNGLAELWRSADCRQSLARIQAPEDAAAESADYRLHPALLDACFQALGATFLTESDEGEAWLPVGVNRFTWLAEPHGDWWCHAVLQPGSPAHGLAKGDLYLYDEEERLFAVVNGLNLQRASRGALERLLNKDARQGALYAITWQTDVLAAPDAAVSAACAVFADSQGIADALLSRCAQHPLFILPGKTRQDKPEQRQYLDPNAAADFQSILQAAHSAQPLQNAVYLWGVDTKDPDGWQTSLQGLLHLVQALAALENPPRLYIVTRGAQDWLTAGPVAAQHSLWGLARSIQLEHPELRCTCIDLDPAALPAANARGLAAELAENSVEDQIVLRNEARFVARLAVYQPASSPTQPVHLDIAARGVLDNLRLLPKPRRAPAAGEVEIRVQATGVNFRDVLNALGMYPGDPGPLGGECAGLVSAVGEGVTGVRVGDAVFGIAWDSFSTYAVTDARLVVRKPAAITFAEAASIPSVFLTAYYGLRRLANVQAGQRVLVHAAAGGVGLAAVQIAKQAGAIVFGTAGSPEKRAWILTQGVDYALDSRTLHFSDKVLELTGGSGVDIVLNSLAGEFIPRSVACLGPRGYFLEIGKRDIWSSEQMAAVRPEARYSVYDLAQVIQHEPEFIQAALQEITAAFGSGALHLEPVRIYPLEQAGEAFRFMAQARHVGKLVLTQPAEPADAVGLRADATYLITGGLGGLGPFLAEALLHAGARHIALLGLAAPTPETQAILDRLAATGDVRVFTGDVTDPASLASVLRKIEQEMPALKGIIHAAGILRDGVLIQQTWERFAPVLAPKAIGAQVLLEQAGERALDFVVFFSSAAGVIGSAGQGNYAAANAFLDSFALRGWQASAPLLSISWGGWTSAGMAARLSDQDQQRFARQGLVPLTPERGTAILTSLLNTRGHVIALPFDWEAFVRSHAGGAIPPLYSNVTRAVQAKAAKASAPAVDVRMQLTAAPLSKRRPLLQAHLREHAVRVLGLSASFNLDARQPLRDLGMDSLMAVELRNAISASLQQKLPSTLLFDFPTIEALTDFLSAELWPAAKTEPGEPAGKPAPADTTAVENLTDEEAEALLLAELEKTKKK